MVLCEIDSVGILVEPLRSKTAGKTTRAFEKLIDRLSKQRIKTKNIVLDNEISGEFKKAVDNRQLTYQLVPPNDHRRNRADRAIQTFKAHFISILCDVDEKFPIELWCRLLTQADLILNLLRPATHTPSVSANAYLFGKFNYNTHPLASLGTAVEMNLVPTARETWAPHSATGYHVGVSLEHYRCYRELIKAMRSKRIGHTVFFKHKYLTMPNITNADALLITAKDLQTALKGGVPQALQLTAAVRQLMEIFKANAEAARRKEQESESQRVQRERALRERLQMDHEHAEAAATEEPPNLSIGTLMRTQTLTTKTTTQGQSSRLCQLRRRQDRRLVCPWCRKTMMSRTHPRPTPERGASYARCRTKPMSIWKQQWF